MDTHPPVWRRVVVPEKMSFADLHCVIQEIFGWEDMHLHIFESPGNSFEIVKSKKDAVKSMFMIEKKTPVGPVRYTYDFGDDWQHKVIFEKKMPEYTADHAAILKVKGDNFIEDFCGDWDADMQPEKYDMEAVNHNLEKMLDFRGTVNGRCLSEFLGDRLIIGSGKDHVPDIKRTRKQDCPDCIYQMQLIDQDKSRDHSSTEKHGNEKNNIEEISSHKFFLGHWICCQQSYQN